jgi:hypothetical protein
MPISTSEYMNNLRSGMDTGGGIEMTTTLADATRSFRTGGLTYPSEVGTMSRDSHYVQFFVNEQLNGSAEFSVGAYVNGGTNNDRNPGSIKRAPTVRTLGSICLYMPAQIQVSQKANYGEAEIGLVVAAALASGRSLGGDGSNFDLGTFAKTVGGEAANTLASAMEGAGATGAKAALAIKEGKTRNNRTEMKFEGIDRRAFQFSFRLMPKSADEAKRIEHIVTMFRLHSMPQFDVGDLGRTLIAPSTFDIEYFPSEHLHRIGTCVLEAVDVKFGGERPQFFNDGQPVETELTLQFKELEIVTKEKIAKGY